jgi:tRNA-2-methylthio-N6-dimethylallyladenosine synthase
MADVVPEREKTERIMALQALQRDIQVERHAAEVGGVREVLVDSLARRARIELGGRTSGNTVVTFPGPGEWLGRLVPVRIVSSTPHGLRGEAVDRL